ncbi:MAG TPA: SDR family NAD(P)-dependent oxidoreductase [Aeromicrobium sp.]|nr:SDR family NAD(P)-dependent oxidoreductase [Aeromicrobium sp.]
MIPQALRSASSREEPSLRGKTIVITGASSGIGAEAARLFAREGATVCLVARRADLLDELVAQITRDGGSAVAYPVDLTDQAATAATVQKILADHAAVDILVNNAARSIRRSITEAADRLHDYERTMAINYTAAVQLTLGFIPRFREQGHGHVVFSSTMSTQLPVPLFSAYVASKAAAESFARSINAELSHRHITATVVHFPMVRTEMSTATGAYDALRMMSPRKAARMLVKAAAQRPIRVSQPLGLVGEVGMATVPQVVTAIIPRLLHQRDRQLAERTRE